MQQSYPSQTTPLISYDTLLGVLDAAEELGGDLTQAINDNNIDPRLLSAPSGFLPVYQLVGFLNDAANLLGCPHFGLVVGKHQPPLHFGATGWAPRFATNLREGIMDAIEFSSLNSELPRWELREEAEYVRFVRHNRVALTESLWHLEVLSLAIVYKSLKHLTQGAWYASQITFSYDSSHSRRVLEEFFEAPVLFNENTNSIVFLSHLLELPNANADKNLHDALKSHLLTLQNNHPAGDDVISNIRYKIKQNLGTNRCNLNSIAQQIGVHPRTLQRELAENCTSFRQLLNEVRQEMIEHYLCSSNVTLTELSDMLGYRSPSALSRAFKNFTGKSPDLWRKQQVR